MIVANQSLQEANASELDLPEDDPCALEFLIRYLYKHVLDLSPRPESIRPSAFVIHVYAIADKYMVPKLRSIALKNLTDTCDPAKDADDFIDALKVVDECTADDSIWNILLPRAKTHMQALLAKEYFMDTIMEQKTLVSLLLSHAVSSTKATEKAPTAAKPVILPPTYSGKQTVHKLMRPVPRLLTDDSEPTSEYGLPSSPPEI